MINQAQLYISSKLVSRSKMNSIYRAISSREQNKNTISLFGVKTSTMKHRNFSNSRLITPHFFIDMDFNSNNKRQTAQKDGMINKSTDLKKYCFNRLRTSHEQKIQGIRKNSSLKVMKRTDSHTFFNKSKIAMTKITQNNNTQSVLVKPEDKYSNQIDKGKSISIKRRVELIKKNQNKLKLIQRSKESQQIKDAPKSDISLGEGFQKFAHDFQRTSTGNKIWSQNMLGEGLKKSSSKIKILVKNPFQKLMKQDQQKNLYLKYASQIQAPIQEMKQSQILSKLQQSSTSIAQRCELEQMLAMM